MDNMLSGELLFMFVPFSLVAVLELPSLRISPCNDSLCVYLQSPSELLLTAYMKFKYTLNVTSEKGNQVRSVFSSVVFT